MSQSVKVHIPENIHFSKVDGESVLLNTENGVFYGLDEIGTRIWELIAKYQETDSVIQQMLKEYEVKEQKLKEDVDSLLDSLIKKGLIEKSEDS